VSPAAQSGLAVLAWALACWPLADWYVRRVLFVPDQAWLALAPLTALALVLGRRGGPTPGTAPRRWLPSILLMAGYAAAYPVLPMTLRGLVAAAALLFLPGSWRPGFFPAAPVAGLCLLGLPAMAMFQFYFGFPLQLAAAALAVPILKTAGFAVVREGALLTVDGQGVGVDAACSGIRMGWAGLYLALTLAGLAGLGWRRTAAACAGAGILVLLLNAVRVAALFAVDAFGLGGHPVLHAGTGVMLFVFLAAGLAAWVRRLDRRRAS
jgi:exosortase/archaeosortase family protein